MNPVIINRKAWEIILISIVCCFALYLIEQVFMVNYLVKTILKIWLFISTPLIYLRVFNKQALNKNDNLIVNKINRRGYLIRNLTFGVTIGLGAFLIVICTYLLLKNYINIDGIVQELQVKLKITKTNYLLVGIYIILGNSFIEEFFFRGFVFLELNKLGNIRIAYLFSSILFSIYHISIFKTWFSPIITGIALLGLFVIGLVFDWVDTKINGIWNSWIIHILADIAVIAIGYTMIR